MSTYLRSARCIVRIGPPAVLSVLLASCGGDAPTEVTETDVVTPASLTLDLSQVDLFVGGGGLLRATALDATGVVVDAALTWTSSDTTVARVTTGGYVTGWGHGTADIGVSASGPSASARAVVTGLEDPMGGVLNEDYFYTNYMDRGLGDAIRDYTCGPKSYDGHHGVDIVLPDFKKMDAGVHVVAAAPGTVIQTHDGEYDRHKQQGDNQWNVVILDHRGQLQSVYGHLKSGSVAVSLGDEVTTGTKLGEVGSSGRSDMPHLHFELRQDGGAVDPYGGECSSTREYYREPLPYQNQFRLIATEVSDRFLDLDLVKDGLAPVDTIDADDTRVTAWSHLHNKGPNASLRFDLYRPDGSFHGSVDVTRPQFYSMSWWWAWWSRTGLDPWPGRWTVRMIYEGELMVTRHFELVGVSAGEAPRRTAGPSSGSGGGAIRGER